MKKKTFDISLIVITLLIDIIMLLLGILIGVSFYPIRIDYDSDTHIASFYDNQDNIIQPYLSENGNHMVYVNGDYIEMTEEEWNVYYDLIHRKSLNNKLK